MKQIRQEISDAVNQAVAEMKTKESTAVKCQFGSGRGMVYICHRQHIPCPVYNNPQACKNYKEVKVYQ